MKAACLLLLWSCFAIKAVPLSGTATISYGGSPYCATGTATVTLTGQTGGTFSSASGLSLNATTGTINLSSSFPGTYTVTYTYSGGTASTSVLIRALPGAIITYGSGPFCPSGMANITISGTSGGIFSSTTGLSLNSTTGAINLGASTPGTYTVTYNFNNGICSNVKSTTITIRTPPTASISYSGSPYCPGGSASPVQTGQGGGTYSSTTGLSLNSATGVIDLAASMVGVYTVTYTFTNGTCSNKTTASVEVRDPVLAITNPPAVCAPDSINMTSTAVTAGSDPGLSYAYYTDATGTNTLPDPTGLTTSGTYYIKGTNSANGCITSILPVTVTVNARPSLSLSGDTSVCTGGTDTLLASTTGDSIGWLGLDSGQSAIVHPTMTTTYYAVAANTKGCFDTAGLEVHVAPFIVALTPSADPVLSGTQVTLNSSGNFAYTVNAWLPADDFSDQSALTQTLTVHDTDTSFSVIARSGQGCMDTASLHVNVDANMKDFFVPNAFSPNNDGKNDVFKVYGSSVKELKMLVFDQWGELVFESEDPQRGWDGTHGGHAEPAGIYIYVIKVVFSNGHTYSKKGTVSLVR